MTSDRNLEQVFPALSETGYEVTSPSDPKYNCVAWAAGDIRRWWEPDPMGISYWPTSSPREYTLDAYSLVFESLGYEVCENADHESGFTKVAIFAKGTYPKHAARQVSANLWTSKLGRDVDISHRLHALSGQDYGKPTTYLRRPESPPND